jgi:transposase-like protein
LASSIAIATVYRRRTHACCGVVSNGCCDVCHRFPSEIIAHAVWLHLRFPLSLRLVEEMVPERPIVVSYETIRCWAIKFDPDYARRLKSDVVCAG